MKNRAIGLELADRQIFLVEIYRKRAQIAVSRWQRVELALGVIESGEIQDLSSLRQAVLFLFPKKVFNRSIPLYVGISGLKAFVRKLTLPNVPLNELKKIIHWEGESILPHPIEQVIYNSQILDRTEAGYQVLFSALPEERLARYLQLFDNLALPVESLTLNPFGLFNFWEYFFKLATYNGVIARVLDDQGDFLLVSGGQIQLVRTVTLGDVDQGRNRGEIFVFELISTLEHFHSLGDLWLNQGLFLGPEELYADISAQMSSFQWSEISLKTWASLIENDHSLELIDQSATAIGLALLGVNR